MSSLGQRHDTFEQGGPIIIRTLNGLETHVVPPVHLGNDIAAAELLPEILRILDNIYGSVQSREDGKDADPESAFQWWEWELHNARTYTIERRSFQNNVGASGAVEQLIIALLAAASYDTVKMIAKAIAKAIGKVLRQRFAKSTVILMGTDEQFRIEYWSAGGKLDSVSRSQLQHEPAG
jgi:hypothetical protein